jgi:uncharacterized protein (TIGR03067 family)
MTGKYRKACRLLLAAIGLLVAAGPKDDEDLARLRKGPEGKWTLVAWEYDGRWFHAESDLNWTWIRQGMMRNLVAEQGVSVCDYRLDPQGNGFELLDDRKPDEPPWGCGIYKFQGGYLWICTGPGRERPTEFRAPENSGRMMNIYKRRGP